jgi:hypothetical protein
MTLKDKVNVLLIRTDTSIITSNVSKNLDIDNLDTKNIDSLFKVKGKGTIKRFCDWKLNKFTISIYGWKDGNAGQENKTELPPPEDTDLYFGDILVIKSNSKGIKNITLNDYHTFIEESNGGFESLGSNDTDSDNDQPNEYDLTDEFIDNSSQVNNYSGESESSMSDRITDEESDDSE